MRGERTGDVGGKRDIIVASRGEQGLWDSRQVPRRQATNRFFCRGEKMEVLRLHGLDFGNSVKL